MDLGIAGKTAFVAASSQGLGLACARALLAEGVQVTINGRDDEKLQRVADALAHEFPNQNVRYIAADLNTTSGRATIVEVLADVDILVTNNAGPAPGRLDEWSDEALLEAFTSNALAAISLIRSFTPGMRRRKFGRIINITSAMVTSPAYDMGLSTSARAALTAISKAISNDVVADNVTLNNLLPERIDTPRQEFMARRFMERDGLTYDEARAKIASTIRAGRMGLPEEFGAACAFLCSVHAGYISGQNLRLDGGSYGGLI